MLIDDLPYRTKFQRTKLSKFPSVENFVRRKILFVENFVRRIFCPTNFFVRRNLVQFITQYDICFDGTFDGTYTFVHLFPILKVLCLTTRN